MALIFRSMNYTFIGILLGTAVSICYCKTYEDKLNKNEIHINHKFFLTITGGITGSIIGCLCNDYKKLIT